MDIILTHSNSDFDALASQQAAARLFEHAHAVLAPQLNANVAEFLGLHRNELRLIERSQVPDEPVSRFILVDTDRIWGEWPTTATTATMVIDHHTRSDADAGAAEGSAGATTTLLVSRLLENGLPLSPTEATLFLLGIYEDTGDLTYTDTTPADVRVVAALLERGGDLGVLAHYRHRALTADQDRAYQALFDQLHSYDLLGWPVLTGWAQLDQHTPGLSGLAERLRDIYAPAVLVLALGIGSGGTQLVGRGDGVALDMGLLMREWGGGGHAQAAAAFVRDHEPAALLRQIEERLPALITPALTAGQIMTRSVRSLPPEASIVDAAELLRRWSYNAIPVVDAEGSLLGDIGRAELTKAERHNLGAAPVRRYLWRSPATVGPDTPIRELRQKIAGEPRGRVYVVAADRRLLGLVTRSDILHYTERPERPSTLDAERAARFAATLDPLTYGRIEWASDWAARQGWGLYAVGGFVRDMILGRQPGDLDVVVEGDAIAVAQALVAATGGVLHAHAQFGTATVEWEQPASHLDFITARTEFYEHPTALPQVAAASLRHDLHRRDFTINTLALDLAPGRRGHLYDFYGGMRDLERKLIRVLHNLSFIDDPTRLLRALRLAARLGFAIEARTGELIHDAVAQNVLHRTTPARIRHELRLLFEEDFAAQTLALLNEWGILAAIHADLRWTERLAEQFAQVLGLERTARRTARLLLLLAQLPAAARQALASRYELPKAERERIGQWAALEQLSPQLAAGDLGAGTLDRLLAPYAEDSLRAFAIAAGGRVARRIEHYLAVLRHIPSRTTGRDLIAQGLPPGPGYRERLIAAREEQLNREENSEFRIQNSGKKTT